MSQSVVVARKDDTGRRLLPESPGYSFVDRERKAVVEEKMALEDTSVWRKEVSERLGEMEVTLGEFKTIKNMLKWLVGLGGAATLGFVITGYVSIAKQERMQQEFDEHRHASIVDAHPGATEVIGQLRVSTATTASRVDQLSADEQRRDEETQRRLDRIEQSVTAIAQHHQH